MRTHHMLAAAAALLSATPALAQYGDEPLPTRWSSPTAFDSRPHARGVSLSASLMYGEYKGRKLESREYMLFGGITDRIGVWYAWQDYFARGISSQSRFDVDSHSFGARYVAIAPTTEKPTSLALEYEGFRPGFGRARTSNSTATYSGTTVDSFGVTYGDARGLQYQLGYARAEARAAGKADILSLGVGKDFDLSDRFRLRLQGQVFGQNVSDPLESRKGEVKPVLYAAVGYRLTGWARVEADAVFMPSGVPIASGRLTGLSSFLLNRPGGATEGLRRDAIGFGSIRLVFHKSF